MTVSHSLALAEKKRLPLELALVLERPPPPAPRAGCLPAARSEGDTEESSALRRRGEASRL